MKTSLDIRLTADDVLTTKRWLGEGHVYVHGGTEFVSIIAAPDDLERLAAACIAAANLVRERERGAA